MPLQGPHRPPVERPALRCRKALPLHRRGDRRLTHARGLPFAYALLPLLHLRMFRLRQDSALDPLLGARRGLPGDLDPDFPRDALRIQQHRPDDQAQQSLPIRVGGCRGMPEGRQVFAQRHAGLPLSWGRDNLLAVLPGSNLVLDLFQCPQHQCPWVFLGPRHQPILGVDSLRGYLTINGLTMVDWSAHYQHRVARAP